MKYVLKLYITKNSPSSQMAITNLKKLLENTELDEEYNLEIIDVIKHPQLAEDEKIIATPILVKKLPPPVKKIIGDLSNKEKVLLGLDLIPIDKT